MVLLRKSKPRCVCTERSVTPVVKGCCDEAALVNEGEQQQNPVAAGKMRIEIRAVEEIAKGGCKTVIA